jgi:YYY domain-containing protein
MGELFTWWLAAEALGVIALPLAAVLGANLPDRGWGLARPLGLLALGWLVWFPLSLVPALPYSRAWIAGTLIVLALANAALLRVADIRTALARLIVHEWGYLLAGEAVFGGAFALMGWLRSFTPAVVDTEKFMDVAFLSAIWRAPHLPAPDPWLAGYAINYYYFGHFLVATVAKLLGTSPAVAFNTGVVLIFALTASAVFAVAANIVAAARPLRTWALVHAAPFGVVSALLVLVLGNLNGAQVWWHAALTQVGRPPHNLSSPWAWWLHPYLWTQYDWWGPSRVIVAPSYTINEFPAFSFILADLHAHVLALPFAGLALGVALNLLLARGEGLRAFGSRGLGILALGVSALALGDLYAINGWDLPTYLGLALLALAVQQWLAHERRWSTLFLLDLASAGIMLVALAVLFYVPFYRGFSSPAAGVGFVPGSRRSLAGEELAIFGLPLFLVGSLLVVRLSAWVSAPFGAPHGADGGQTAPSPRPVGGPVQVYGLLVVGGVLAVLLLTALTPNWRSWPLVWSLLLLAGCAALALQRLVPRTAQAAAPSWEGRSEVFVWCLVGTAAALVGASEVIYLRDVFDGGTAFRMNTVFKLYYQAWLLLGVAGGPALAALLRVGRASLAPILPAPPIAPAGVSSAEARPRASLVGRVRATQARLALSAARPDAAGAASNSGALAGLPAASGAAHDTTAAAASARDTSERTGCQLEEPASANGALAPPIWATALRWLSAGGTLVWVAALVALLGAALIYPVQAAAARTVSFALPHSLDGTAFMASDPLNGGDAAAIAWLSDSAHVSGDPVVVEASGGEYTHYGRVSAFTGLPTILGWAGHEWQWRVNWLLQPEHVGLLDRRQADVDQIYTSGDSHVVLALLARYDARYLYVGAAERTKYPGADLGRFASFLHVVYHEAGVTIYQVG